MSLVCPLTLLRGKFHRVLIRQPHGIRDQVEETQDVYKSCSVATGLSSCSSKTLLAQAFQFFGQVVILVIRLWLIVTENGQNGNLILRLGLYWYKAFDHHLPTVPMHHTYGTYTHVKSPDISTFSEVWAMTLFCGHCLEDVLNAFLKVEDPIKLC